MALHAPYAFLPPRDGDLLSFVTYTVVGCLAVLIMDIGSSLVEDYRLLSTHKMSTVTIVYLVSRFSSLGFILDSALIYTAPLLHCSRTAPFASVTFVLYRASTGALFYVRVIAVYPKNRFVKLFFGVLWLFMVACAALVPRYTTAITIGPTKYCAPFLHGTVSEMLLTPLAGMVYDVVVCLAIAYSLRIHQFSRDGIKGWRVLFWGSVPSEQRLIDRFYRDSLLYSVISLWLKVPELLVTAIFIAVAPSFHGIQAVMTYPDMVVTSILAAKIYRDMKLGRKGLLPFGSTGMNPTFSQADADYQLTTPEFRVGKVTDSSTPSTFLNTPIDSKSYPVIPPTESQ